MRYRLYQPGDFAQLYAIEEACFQPPLRFSQAYVRQLVKSSSAATWVAENDGELAGFAVVKHFDDASGPAAYVETIEVAVGARKQGIGDELLRRVEDSARAAGAHTIWLHVDAENAPAIRLYEAHCYRQQGREENYYAQKRAALIYAKPLSGDEQPGLLTAS